MDKERQGKRERGRDREGKRDRWRGRWVKRERQGQRGTCGIRERQGGERKTGRETEREEKAVSEWCRRHRNQDTETD